MTNSDAMMPARSVSAAFNQVDKSHQGYVTREAVSGLQDVDFQSADKNNDGGLRPAEFQSAWGNYSKHNQ